MFVGLFVVFIVDRYNTNRSVAFRIKEADILLYRAKKWQSFVVKGVNMSPGGQGTDIGKAPVSKNEYGRIFRRLAAQDVNVIRVQSILSPDFYKALFEYNILTNKPIYLFQGVLLDSQDVKIYQNAYETRLNDNFTEVIRRTIDVLHGKAELKQINGQGIGKYNVNVAPYVIGYNLLCDLDDEGFVTVTNEKNTDVVGFEGDYLYTENASPYEAWLAALGNFAVTYEQGKYGGPDRLVSWMSWEKTEPMANYDNYDNEENSDDDEENNEKANTKKAVVVNIDRVRVTEKYNAGILTPRQLREKFAEL